VGDISCETGCGATARQAKLADKPGSVVDSHSSKAPSYPGARATYPGTARATLSFPYLVLLRMGFDVPSVSPPTRCALTAPFHPCLSLAAIGGLSLCATFHRLTASGS
jgi:hypothetical protein